MRNLIDPRQPRLFDPFGSVLTQQTRQRLMENWPGVFRHVLLELMPAGALAEHFDPVMGRPSKELYAMAGLIFLKECFNWSNDEALNAYCFHMDVHYALNLEPVAQNLSIRTLEQNIARFETDELAKTVMADVTVRLVKLLELKIDRQRLDSTHVFSDMASFGRTRLMGAAIKRFLTQVKRHDMAAYEALAESLRQRYAHGVNQLFADTQKDSESRRLLREQVAQDMYALVKQFAGNSKHQGKDTYKTLERIFYEQCEVYEGKVVVKQKTGGNVMQNPSDADATFDGHKGPGYQVQLSETCHPDNAVQLITCAIPQTAAESDSDAVEKVLNALTAHALVPDEMLVDTAYAGDGNVQHAQEKGVELVGPVTGCSTELDGDLNIDDFNIDEATEVVICCPAGHAPQSSVHDKQTGKTKTVMSESICGACEFRRQCPVKKTRDGYQLDHTARDRRIAARRKEQATEVFKERYKVRSGIEGTNSGVKRKTGLGRLRVRGRPAVYHAILLKVAGWNMLRAAACAKLRKIVYERACRSIFGQILTILRSQMTTQSVCIGRKTKSTAYLQRYGELSPLHVAA
jgi:hypothetical protein